MSKLIIPLGLIFASLGIIVFLVVPGWQHFLSTRTDTKHVSEINGEIETLTQKRDSLGAQIAGISKDNLQRIDQIVPTGAQGPEFLVTIQQIAANHGLQVKKLDLGGTLATKPRIPEKTSGSFAPSGISAQLPVNNVSGANPEMSANTVNSPVRNTFAPSGVAEAPTYQTITVGIDITGQYDQFKDFLRELESYVRITNVDSLTFASVSGTFDFKLSVKAYYQ